MNEVTDGMTDRTHELWALPVPSQEFMEGPVAKIAMGACTLSYDYETPSGAYDWERIAFREVEAVMLTAHDACSEEQVAAYDTLVEVIESPWIAELQSRRRLPLAGLRHLRIYFDEAGCYEIAAVSFDPPPARG